VWLPRKDAVVRSRAQELAELHSVEPRVEEILHAAAAARLLSALDEDLLLAPSNPRSSLFLISSTL